jgi:hypothetical protein
LSMRRKRPTRFPPILVWSSIWLRRNSSAWRDSSNSFNCIDAVHQSASTYSNIFHQVYHNSATRYASCRPKLGCRSEAAEGPSRERSAHRRCESHFFSPQQHCFLTQTLLSSVGVLRSSTDHHGLSHCESRSDCWSHCLWREHCERLRHSSAQDE